MASHGRQLALEVGEPDIGFQAGFGFYLGLVAAGAAATAGLLAGVTTATLLGVLPTTVTAVAIVGHVLAKRAHGLPERIGRSRRYRLACYVPPVAFAATLLGSRLTPIDATGRFVALTLATVLVTGVAAFGVDRMARNRYVDAITADDPAATWTFQRAGLTSGGVVFSACMGITVVVGLAMAVLSNSVYGLFVAAYGVFLYATSQFDLGGEWNDFDPAERWNPPTVRAHEAGLVVDKQFAKTFVPWDDVADVRLTDDELVVERRWRDLRCARSVIDDPEAVLEGIERARGRAGDRRRTDRAD